MFPASRPAGERQNQCLHHELTFFLQPKVDLLVIDGIHALLRPHHSEDKTKTNKTGWDVSLEALLAQAMVLLKHLLATGPRGDEGRTVGAVLLTSLLNHGFRSRPGHNTNTSNRSAIVGQSLSLNPGGSYPVVEGRFSCWADTVDLAVLVAPVESSVAGDSHNCGVAGIFLSKCLVVFRPNMRYLLVVGVIKQPNWMSLPGA